MASLCLLPSYFGPCEGSLFGCYSSPGVGQRSCAVVICPPIGHEYINSHRALHQLALRLGSIGFPVLRFDYSGCGDSSGDAAECRISQWMKDVAQAISEAQSRTHVQNVCLIGLRLGATLSLLTAARRSNVKAVVLWDPVVKGKEHLEGLIALNRQLLRFRPKPQKQRADWPKDIVGFPIGRSLYDDIDQIDLLAISKKPARDVFIVETETNPSLAGLKGLLESMGVSIAFRHADAPQVWLPSVDGGLQVPMSVLQFVASWLDRTCP